MQGIHLMRSGYQTDHEERCDASVSRRRVGKEKRTDVETVVGRFDDRECVRESRCAELGVDAKIQANV